MKRVLLVVQVVAAGAAIYAGLVLLDRTRFAWWDPAGAADRILRDAGGVQDG